MANLTVARFRYVRLFSAIAWIILFIACINFMNLATARAGQRVKEIGVRKNARRSKKALIGQFILEALLMSVIAMLLSYPAGVSLPAGF